MSHENTPVTIVSHSMGGLWSLHVFNTMSQEWKDKYIKKWIPISPAYGGSVDEMNIMVDKTKSDRSYESNYWLLPNKKLWNNTEVLVSTPSKNYTIYDINDLFADAGHLVG